MKKFKITDVRAREVLDSRGYPTVEAEVEVDGRLRARAIVPSGASTGTHEALELRDASIAEHMDEDGRPWSQRYGGKGVLQAVKNVNTVIRQGLVDHNVCNQGQIDEIMLELDGTEDKSRLGANAMLSVSLAAAKAAAKSLGIPLYRYIGGVSATVMPVPMMNIINGGVHAKNDIDFQEFMIMPVGAKNFREGLRMGAEVYHCLKDLLAERGKITAVGDEGGFAPDLADAFEVFSYLTEAVKRAGYCPGEEIAFAMDAAASELYEENSGMYYFPGESRGKQRKMSQARVHEGAVPDTCSTKVLRSTKEMISYYEKLCGEFPIYSIEDGLHEEDFEGWHILTECLGRKVQLVGDDLFVTNKCRLQKGILQKAANSILIKVNQIGTLSETIETIHLAKAHGYTTVMSHRSGETEDVTIADLAVAFNCGQIKTGAPCRGERTAKYNQLIRIEESIVERASYPGRRIFPRKWNCDGDSE